MLVNATLKHSQYKKYLVHTGVYWRTITLECLSSLCTFPIFHFKIFAFKSLVFYPLKKKVGKEIKSEYNHWVNLTFATFPGVGHTKLNIWSHAMQLLHKYMSHGEATRQIDKGMSAFVTYLQNIVQHLINVFKAESWDGSRNFPSL